jgi:hypothetical protein
LCEPTHERGTHSYACLLPLWSPAIHSQNRFPRFILLASPRPLRPAQSSHLRNARTYVRATGLPFNKMCAHSDLFLLSLPIALSLSYELIKSSFGPFCVARVPALFTTSSISPPLSAPAPRRRHHHLHHHLHLHRHRHPPSRSRPHTRSRGTAHLVFRCASVPLTLPSQERNG